MLSGEPALSCVDPVSFKDQSQVIKEVVDYEPSKDAEGSKNTRDAQVEANESP